MPKYLISWEESTWYNVQIDADSDFAALAKFENNEYDSEDAHLVFSEMVEGKVVVDLL